MKKIFLSFALVIFTAAGTLAQTDIADARTFTLGATVTITGIVTNGTELGIIRYIQDGSAGIACYPGTGSVTFTPNRGDSITITGTLKDYNGLLEIDPITSFTTNSTGNMLPTPQVVTPNQIGESTEGELIQINNAVFNEGCGNFSGNAKYSFSDNGEWGDIYVRNGSDIVGVLIPVGQVTLVGISSQFTFSSPANDGYQVLTRDLADIGSSSVIKLTTCLAQTNITTTGFDLSWTTDIAGSTNISYGLTKALEIGDINLGGSTHSHALALTGLSAAMFYYVRAYTVSGSDTGFSGISVFSTASNSTGEIIVYFNKSVDNAFSGVTDAISIINNVPDTIVAFIDRAQSTLDVAVYNNSNSSIVQAINDAYNRGVTVRYVSDLTTLNSALSSLDPGIQVLKGNNDGIMHHKFVVIDVDSVNSSWILSGSTNWTSNNLNSDYNNLIFIQDQALAKAFTMEFEEMWGSSTSNPNPGNAKFGSDKTDDTPHDFIIGGNLVELYFSPSDNTTNHLVNAVATSNSDLEFALLSFTRDELGIEVLNRHNAGSDVKGIIEDVNGAGTEYTYLTTNGVDVQSHSGVPFVLHHKYCVVDATNAASDPLVITGSHNWSTSAETKNDENTLIVHNEVVANMYYEEFMTRYCELSTTTCTMAAVISSSNVSCNNDCNGWAAVAVSSGTPPYTYSWTPGGETTDTISSLCPGTYTVNVTDGASNTDVVSITISEPIALTLSTSSTAADCGSTTATATAVVTGGTTPHTYLWDDPMAQTNATATGLSGGTYTAYITDANGCTDTISETVQGSPAVFLDSISTSSPSICGATDGMATSYVSSGTLPYTYSWNSNPVQTNSIATGLLAGSYTVVLTDNSGCMDSSMVSLSDVGAALLSITGSAPTCFGGNDGTATVSPTGGNTPYTYLWDDLSGQTTATANGLAAGNYSVMVADSVGCASAASVSITEPTAISITVETATEPTCNGVADGEISVTASGGTGTLQYSIDGGNSYQSSSTFTALSQGSYNVMVMDSNSCTLAGSVLTITEPAAIIIDTFVIHVVNPGSSTGAIFLTVSGGTGLYNYLWSPGGETIEDLANIPAGDYTITVTDGIGCEVSLQITVQEPTGIHENAGEIWIRITPNPSDGIFVIAMDDRSQGDYLLQVRNILGQVIFEKKDSRRSTALILVDLSKNERGVYFMTITTDANRITEKIVVSR